MRYEGEGMTRKIIRMGTLVTLALLALASAVLGVLSRNGQIDLASGPASTFLQSRDDWTWSLTVEESTLVASSFQLGTRYESWTPK